MLEKHGFIAINNGGNGTTYLRTNLIAVIVDNPTGDPEKMNSEIRLQGCDGSFYSKDNAKAICEAIERTDVARRQYLLKQP